MWVNSREMIRHTSFLCDVTDGDALLRCKHIAAPVTRQFDLDPPSSSHPLPPSIMPHIEPELVVLHSAHTALLNDAASYPVRFDSELLIDIIDSMQHPVSNVVAARLLSALSIKQTWPSLLDAQLYLTALISASFEGDCKHQTRMLTGPPARGGLKSRLSSLYFPLLKAKIAQHEQLTLELTASAAFGQHCVAPEAVVHPFDTTLNARGYFLNDLRWLLIEAADE